MSVTAPRITWFRTEAWSALVFDKTVTIDADEDRIAVSVDGRKSFAVGVIADDKVKAEFYERGALSATFTLDQAKAEKTLREMSIQLQGHRVPTGELWAFDLSLGDIAMRAWSAHLRMRRLPEVADTALTPAAPLQVPASASTNDMRRTVH